MVISLEQGASDLHMVQLMTLLSHHLLLQYDPEWFTLLELAYPGCPDKKVIGVIVCCVVIAVLILLRRIVYA